MHALEPDRFFLGSAGGGVLKFRGACARADFPVLLEITFENQKNELFVPAGASLVRSEVLASARA